MPRGITSCALALFFLSTSPSFSLTVRSTRVAVLDFGISPTGLRAAGEIRKTLSTKAVDASSVTEFEIVDPDQSRAAALGAGFEGSLNLTLQQARDLGAAI